MHLSTALSLYKRQNTSTLHSGTVILVSGIKHSLIISLPMSQLGIMQNTDLTVKILTIIRGLFLSCPISFKN